MEKWEVTKKEANKINVLRTIRFVTTENFRLLQTTISIQTTKETVDNKRIIQEKRDTYLEEYVI